MRGLIDRITNRDIVASLELELESSRELAVGLQRDLDEKEASLLELGEKADELSGAVRVLKMRIDMLLPVAPVKEDVKDESK